MLYTTTKENEKNIGKSSYTEHCFFFFIKYVKISIEIGTIVYVCIIKEIEQSKNDSKYFSLENK